MTVTVVKQDDVVNGAMAEFTTKVNAVLAVDGARLVSVVQAGSYWYGFIETPRGRS